MSRLVVGTNHELAEGRPPVLNPPPALKVLARFISYVFHPVFVPVYIVLFLLYIHPSIFTGFSPREKILRLAQAVLMFSFFPVITVLLLKALGFIGSIQLHTQKDRIIPLIASMMWYFWIWHVWRNLPASPKESVSLALAIFISSILAMMANIRIKISLHAIAAGVMLAFMFTLALGSAVSFGMYLSVTLLAAGLVCTSRLLVSSHSVGEVYLGLLAGVASQLAANLFVG